MTDYITYEQALALNAEINRRSGGFFAVEERENLRYCLETARDVARDIELVNPIEAAIAKAAHLLFCIGRAHIFLDGNKRTSYALADTFLRLNSLEIVGVSKEEAIRFLVALQAQKTSLRSVQKWLTQHINEGG